MLATLAVAATLYADAAKEEFFEKRARPPLVAQCQACHGPKKANGGLRLDQREQVFKELDAGEARRPEEPAAVGGAA